MSAALQAVIFDMDGVLLDSEPFWQEAEIAAFAEVGLSLDREDCRQTMGMRVDEVVAYWAERRPWPSATGDAARLVERILDGVIDRIRGRGERLPGVGPAIDSALARGWRLGLASSSPERVIAAVLETLDLTSAFDVAVSAEHEERGKPDPGVYLSACARLEVSPARAVAVEDSLAGLRAAHAAGMRCVMVPDASLRGRPELTEAELLLESLEQLDAGAWERIEIRERPRRAPGPRL